MQIKVVSVASLFGHIYRKYNKFLKKHILQYIPYFFSVFVIKNLNKTIINLLEPCYNLSLGEIIYKREQREE